MGRNTTNGLGVFGFGDWSVQLKQPHELRLHDVLPIAVEGPSSFDLFGVWAQNHRAVDHVPEYKRVPQPTALLDVYNLQVDRERPVIIAGDFNNSAYWDKPTKAPFAEMVRRYADLGLVSLYHARTRLAPAR
jgi:hypothetical protein